MTAPKPRWIASSPPRIPIARPCRRSRTSARAWIRSSSLRRSSGNSSISTASRIAALSAPLATRSRTNGSKSDADPCRRPSRRPGNRNNGKTIPLSGNTYLWLDRAPEASEADVSSASRGESPCLISSADVPQGPEGLLDVPKGEQGPAPLRGGRRGRWPGSRGHSCGCGGARPGPAARGRSRAASRQAWGWVSRHPGRIRRRVVGLELAEEVGDPLLELAGRERGHIPGRLIGEGCRSSPGTSRNRRRGRSRPRTSP